jgi:transcriptional regulator with XRE-family HTH domain
MSARELLDPENSLWDLIAVQLRRYREDRKVSGSALGVLLDLDRSSVSRLESGSMKLQEKHAKILDREWDTEKLFTHLVRFARAGHDPNWWRSYTTYEAAATHLKTYAALVIPGLLQTPDYARALLVAGQVVEDVEASVAARMARQEILNRPKPVQLWALVKQSVLEDPVGGPEVMRAQLAHLLEMSRCPNIFLRVVPRSVGAHVGLDGSFSLMIGPNASVAYMEAVGGGRLSLDPAEVARFTVRFDQIGADALSRDATRTLIEQLLEAKA